MNRFPVFSTVRMIALHFVILALCAVAQTSQANKGITASLVPIGANSDAYWEGNGPGIRAIAIDPDAAPPATLCVRQDKGFLDIPGILNRPSIAIPVIGEKMRVFANKNGSTGEDPPLFGEFSIPQTPGHYDIFLNRSKKNKGWEKPEFLVQPSSTTVFQPESFRVINLCDQLIQVKIGNAIRSIDPRAVKIIRIALNNKVMLIAVQAAAGNDEQQQMILRTGIRMEPGQRANVVFYPGRDKAKPYLATWFHQIESVTSDTQNKVEGAP